MKRDCKKKTPYYLFLTFSYFPKTKEFIAALITVVIKFTYPVF